MTDYTILITYQTGNSFNTYEDEREISVTWKDLDKAKAALRAIKEHHEAMDSMRSAWNREEVQKIKDQYKLKDWFHDQGDEYRYTVRVKDDSNEYVDIYAFWHGYFESIKNAKIITVQSEDNDMEINFW